MSLLPDKNNPTPELIKEHSLKSRYQEFKYVLTRVCDEMGHSSKGKDCICGECNNLFRT